MKLVSFEIDFPNSVNEPFGITSIHTPSYNCIAWAFGDDTKWYWPDPISTYYWPINVPREITIEAFIKLYETTSYEVCTNDSLEVGYEKVAIFTDKHNIPTHAARQLENGYWTSKLGQHIDVQHSIKSIEDGSYGKATVFMKRIKIPVGNTGS
jgi:hypothetical protein